MPFKSILFQIFKTCASTPIHCALSRCRQNFPQPCASIIKVILHSPAQGLNPWPHSPSSLATDEGALEASTGRCTDILHAQLGLLASVTPPPNLTPILISPTAGHIFVRETRTFEDILTHYLLKIRWFTTVTTKILALHTTPYYFHGFPHLFEYTASGVIKLHLVHLTSYSNNSGRAGNASFLNSFQLFQRK